MRKVRAALFSFLSRNFYYVFNEEKGGVVMITTLIAILAIALGWYINNIGICYVGIGMLIAIIYNYELTKLRKRGN